MSAPARIVCAIGLMAFVWGCGSVQKIDYGPRGTLRIQGKPDVATIEVDETHLGQVNLFEKKGLLLRPGPHRVIIKADGYFPEYKIVEIEQDKILSLKIELRPIPE
jgi:hypothetical protein